MPTSPSSPLKSRTVSFPQSGLKAGLSDDAFPLKVPSGLPPSFMHTAFRTRPSLSVEGGAGKCASPFKRLLVALPQGSSLQAGYAVPPFFA